MSHLTDRFWIAWPWLLVATVQGSAGEPCTSPPNEDCDGAIVISSVDLPYDITAPLGCFNDEIDKPYFDIFYRYDCTVSGEHVIQMCDSAGDTYLRIYTEGCGWSDGIELATADDECPGSPPNADPFLVVELQAGVSYWLELGTWRPDPPWAPPLNSPYQLSISLAGDEPDITCDGADIDTRGVGQPGNAADGNGLGAVSRAYRIGMFEVTNAQYVSFLNAVAADDPNGLFCPDMTDSDRGGILRGGTPGSFVYWVKSSFGDKPANFVDWSDAARLCNWLHNGQPTGSQQPGTTEDGAYDMGVPLDQRARSADARWFIPTHHEWYKAAYYDPLDPGADGGGTPDYWLYPTRSDSLPLMATADSVGNVANPGTNVANYGQGADWNGENGNVTTVGSAISGSPWGALDMGGNVFEWTETLDNPILGDPPQPTRTGRGGDFSNAGILMSSPDGFSIALNMMAEAANVGVRLAARLCPGDFDGDNDVDEDDLAVFDACFGGPDVPVATPECAVGDFDDDQDIDCDDWQQFQLAWTLLGEPPNLPACAPPADLNGDSLVNAADLAILLGNWGACPGCSADLNGDTIIDAADLAILLGAWT